MLRLWRKRPQFRFIPQLETTDCGAACLAMLLQYLGKPRSLAWCRREAHVGPDGTSMAELARVLQALGFSIRAWRGPLSSLTDDQFPLIVPVHFHFKVLLERRGDKFKVADPALGVLWVNSLDDSSSEHTYLGVATGDSSVAEVPSELSDDSAGSAWSYLRFLHTQVRELLALAALSLALLPTQFSIARAIQDLIDLDPAREGHLALFGRLALQLSVLLLLLALRQKLVRRLSFDFGVRLGNSLTEQLLRLPFHFYQTRKSGDILRRTVDLEVVKEFVANRFVGFVADFILGIGLLVAMMSINVGMGLGIMLMVGLYLSINIHLSKRIRQGYIREAADLAKPDTVFMETIMGIETVKAMRAENSRLQQWLEGYREAQKTRQLVQKDLDSLQLWTEVFTKGTPLLALAIGFWQLKLLRISPGEVGACLMLIFASLSPFASCGALADELQRVIASFRRLRDVFDERTELENLAPQIDQSTQKDSAPETGNSSKDQDPVVHIADERITIYRGEKVLLRGPNGAGKSTLLRILVGLVDSQHRSVRVLDQELKQWSREALRSRIAYLPQATVLFEGTIADNIAFGQSRKNQARIAEVCDLTGAWSVINRFKKGLDHRLYEGGIGLSGGEKQVIALARTLYSNPDILLLDEPTSALDRERRDQFHSLLTRIWGDKTVILTTHDAVDETHFDRVIDLEARGQTAVR